ncbi:PBP1A family penicillin-binding protein [Mesobacillus jeotgali]|uniref:PBP1A family penicillin-binding protein n=1 Tax=Mesobacillus jeotgali TaxID=129985 RepID=A0ABY9VW30_9BACI|nr:PBP1A family penicillin-binding protein [Mesobacillus jeotgali]WNF25186.1 PBP1A family penicillin-binding protein [Mesobacillus jeotgali]
MERRQQRKTSSRIWSEFQKKDIKFKIIGISIGLLLLGLLILNIMIWTSDVSKLEDPAPKPTIIYDQNDAIASKVAASNIEGVSIEQIPEHLIHAVISTEDQRFYKHDGINYFAIAKAFMQNTLNGEIVAGGSTLTQQLAKNAFLTQERTYTRKFKELILTKKIERKYTKDEIIERYLNQIYFGEGAWGIQSAAQTYFGKDVSDLTLSESAMIAGLIKAPSLLSPFKDMDKSIERRDIVLSLMESEGYINQKELEKAKEQQIVLQGKKIDDYKGKYPYYVDHIIEEAIKKYGLTENEILSGGLRIYTEMNPEIQAAVEEVYKDKNMFPDSQSDQLVQSGAVFITPKTGGIAAIVGGRGEHTFRGFNRATQLKRQPGSAMKPLAVYTPALEQGYDMYDKLEDSPINIDGYQPMNYDKQFRGEVTMYDAVVNSYNVPPVWLLDKMGMKYGINAVERFGIKLEEKDHKLGLALGGMNEGVSPLLMAQAFSAFPNKGTMVQAHSIKRIEDAEGNLIGKWNSNATRVTEEKIADKITYMLRGAVQEGTGENARVDGWEIAGKTGTTENPTGNNEGTKDHWFVGYSPEIVGAVWMGYDKTDENHYLTESSGSTVTIIFKEIFSKSINQFSQNQFNLASIEKQIKDQKKKEKQEEDRREEDKKKREREEEKREKEEEKREKEEEKKPEEEEKKIEEEEKKREEEEEKREEEQEKREKEEEKKRKEEEKKDDD